MCAGTRSGGLKARDANKAKNPNFYREIGRLGGEKGRGHTFAHGKFDPRVAGAKGGAISRRGPAKQVAPEPKPSILDRAKELLHAR